MYTTDHRKRLNVVWSQRLRRTVGAAALCGASFALTAPLAGAASGQPGVDGSGGFDSVRTPGEGTCTWKGTPREPTPVYLVTSNPSRAQLDVARVNGELSNENLLELQPSQNPSLWVPKSDSLEPQSAVGSGPGSGDGGSTNSTFLKSFDAPEDASFLVPMEQQVLDPADVGEFGWVTEQPQDGSSQFAASNVRSVVDGKISSMAADLSPKIKKKEPGRQGNSNEIELGTTVGDTNTTVPATFPVAVSTVSVGGQLCSSAATGNQALTFPVTLTYSGFEDSPEAKVSYHWSIDKEGIQQVGGTKAEELTFDGLEPKTPGGPDDEAEAAGAAESETDSADDTDSDTEERVSPSSSKSSPVGIIVAGIVGLLLGAGIMAAVAKSRRPGSDPYGGNPMGHPYPPGGPNDVSYPGAAGMAGHMNPHAVSVASGRPGVSAASMAGAAAAAGGVATALRSNGTAAVAATEGWTVATPGGSAIRLQDVGVTRILPIQTPHGRVWSVGSGAYAATAGWLEKREGKGEDAEPTLRIHASGRGLIGVFDGTGGSGAAVARTTSDGRELTAAYVAARLTRDVVEAWYADAVDEGDRALETAGLAATLHHVLEDESAYLPTTRSAVRGKLHRVLPTTAACLAFDVTDPAATIDAFWAGDSRCFQLTPSDGLQVLSKDDTRELDALALIRNDQPMENLIAADRPFRVNHRRFTPQSPVVLIAASDGAFGYVRTPAHFEYLLLHTLLEAQTLEGWSSGLLAAFSEFAGDDVSFSMVAIGFDDLGGLKDAMRSRHDYLESQHWRPFVAGAGDPEGIERLREESWSVYRDLYHARLDGADAPVPTAARPAGQ